MELSPLLVYFVGQLDAFNSICGLTLGKLCKMLDSSQWPLET